MYRNLLVRPGKTADLTYLTILSRPVSQTNYSRSIPYSKKADTINGVTQMINPTTETFTSATSLTKLRGMYIDLSGVIYFIPTDATFGQVSIGNGTIVTQYAVRASKATRIDVVGFRVFSGVGPGNHLRKCDYFGISNNADDLMIGSVCSSWIEATIHSTDGNFATYIGDQLEFYKVDPKGNEIKIGVFNVEEAGWISKRVYKITAFDNVRKTDVDITDWLRGLTGWPYALTDFYGMICDECGLGYNYNTWTGASSFMVHKFDVEDGTTARQLLSIVCEILCDYCIALPDGRLSANWYRTESTRIYQSKALMAGSEPEKESFYYQNSLSYGDFDVQDIKYVQIREENKKDAPRWPDYGTDADVSNAYIITANPILMAHPTYKGTSTATDSVRNALTKIASRFDFNVYRPFQAMISEASGILPGKYVYVGDADNKILFIAPITTVTWKGHRMTVGCDAKKTRENADSVESMTNAELADYAAEKASEGQKEYADSAVDKAANDQKQYVDDAVDKATQEQKEYTDGVLSRTTQADLFNKVAGTTPGLNLSDGKISTDASFVHNGQTITVSGSNLYTSDSDNDETALEAWLDNHLNQMPSFSTRALIINCYPALGTGSRISGWLYRDREASYAVFWGITYVGYGTVYSKVKNAGTWRATKSLTIGGD